MWPATLPRRLVQESVEWRTRRQGRRRGSGDWSSSRRSRRRLSAVVTWGVSDTDAACARGMLRRSVVLGLPLSLIGACNIFLSLALAAALPSSRYALMDSVQANAVSFSRSAVDSDTRVRFLHLFVIH